MQPRRSASLSSTSSNGSGTVEAVCLQSPRSQSPAPAAAVAPTTHVVAELRSEQQLEIPKVEDPVLDTRLETLRRRLARSSFFQGQRLQIKDRALAKRLAEAIKVESDDDGAALDQPTASSSISQVERRALTGNATLDQVCASRCRRPMPTSKSVKIEPISGASHTSTIGSRKSRRRGGSSGRSSREKDDRHDPPLDQTAPSWQGQGEGQREEQSKELWQMGRQDPPAAQEETSVYGDGDSSTDFKGKTVAGGFGCAIGDRVDRIVLCRQWADELDVELAERYDEMTNHMVDDGMASAGEDDSSVGRRFHIVACAVMQLMRRRHAASSLWSWAAAAAWARFKNDMPWDELGSSSIAVRRASRQLFSRLVLEYGATVGVEASDTTDVGLAAEREVDCDVNIPAGVAPCAARCEGMGGGRVVCLSSHPVHELEDVRDMKEKLSDSSMVNSDPLVLPKPVGLVFSGNDGGITAPSARQRRGGRRQRRQPI